MSIENINGINENLNCTFFDFEQQFLDVMDTATAESLREEFAFQSDQFNLLWILKFDTKNKLNELSNSMVPWKFIFLTSYARLMMLIGMPANFAALKPYDFGQAPSVYLYRNVTVSLVGSSSPSDSTMQAMWPSVMRWSLWKLSTKLW